MNPKNICVHPRSSAVQKSHPPSTSASALWLCALLAIAMHGALLFAWRYSPKESAAATIEGDSVEVSLVESAAAATAALAEPRPPATTPEPVQEPLPVPAQVPLPEPPKKEPAMTLPEPPKPKPTPHPASAATPSPKATQKSATTAKISAAKNPSTATGTTGSASSPTGTTAAGAGSGRSAKASWVVRPAAAYPPESRAAGERGVVILRLVVDGNGRPSGVSVVKSSGYPRLDRAAVEAGWRCRVRDAAPGSHLDAPVRFNLGDR